MPDKEYAEMAKATTDLGDNPNNMALTKAEEKYYNTIIKLRKYGAMWNAEVAFIGAGLGGGFRNTQELHVMKYNEAVDKEHTNMTQYKVRKARMIDELPKHAKILTSTWAMKKRASGKYRA